MIALSALERSPQCPHEVACQVTVDAAPPQRLWFRVEGCAPSALRDDRSDGVVLQFLLKALTEGHDITFATPMSHQLWYALTEIVLPTLCREVPDYRLPRLLGPTTDERAAEGSATAAAALLLGGLVRRFFFPSSGAPTKRLQCYPLQSEYMASWLLPHLSSPETCLTLDDTSATRMEKVRAIAREPVVQRHLLLKPIPGAIPNDTRNRKCVHTLLMLEQIGPDVLERFKERFDLPLYARERHTLLRGVARKWLEGNCGPWPSVREPVLREMTLLDHLRLTPRWCRFLLHKLGMRRKQKRFTARPR